MRTPVLLAFLTVAALSRAQDLYYSFDRSASHTGAQPTYQGDSYPFKVGFIDRELQPLMRWRPDPYVKQDGFDYDKAFGCRDTTFQSCIWWNLGASDLLINGLTMKGGTVTAHSIDKIPAIDLTEFAEVVRYRGTGATVTVTTSASPAIGASTPGQLKLQTYQNGIWHNEYVFDVNGFVSDTRTITITSDLLIRLELVRTGASRASAVMKFRYAISS